MHIARIVLRLFLPAALLASLLAAKAAWPEFTMQGEGKPVGSLLQEELQFDIVINGGSFSAPAAALAAARANPDAEILLLEPTDWLGGQATSQGVAAIDNPWHDPGASLMRNQPTLYYPADYLDFLEQIRAAPEEAPGEGMAPSGSAWVSREAFDPRTAAWVLDQMVSEYANITVLKMTAVKAVEVADVTDEWGAGKRVTALTVIQREPLGGYQPFDKLLSEEISDWYSPDDSADFAKAVYRVLPRDLAKGLVLVEASELGDLMVLSGAIYTVGRELTTETIADDGTLPALDEDGSQSFVFPFCMTDATAALNEEELKSPFPDFESYYQDQVDSFFSFGSYSWNRIWTYRRLKNTGPLYSYDTVNPGDVSMQNWYPGNDYPYGSMLCSRVEAASETADWFGGVMLSELAQTEKHAIAWYFCMKENRPTPWDTQFLRGAHALNMMGTGTGLAKFPYIRGTRRIVGLSNFRVTERYFVDTRSDDYAGQSSFRYYDSVGIGNYAADVHPTWVSTGISPSRHYPAPFYIPYRALGSVNVRNLLAAGKAIATTFITNSAYRLHPIEWAIGSAAGAAAALMIQDGSTNYDLLEIPALRALQEEINGNSPISWAVYDSEAVPDWNGDLIVNDLNPVEAGVPFAIEVYHHRAYRAEIFLGGAFLGETTTRANGRLILGGLTAHAGATGFRAVCYDEEGNVLDVLNELDSGDEPDPSIVD
ncbi:MAG TPA: FAD-dependent oxidoreductase, partial [Firmicutes bacterium]|nr:FAD-dependent oxidoreductase [Bacillota bacterium]